MFASLNHPCLPNTWKEFSSGLASLLVEKLLLAKLCKLTEKLSLSPNFHNTLLADMYRLLPYRILGFLSILVRPTSEKVACKRCKPFEVFSPKSYVPES